MGKLVKTIGAIVAIALFGGALLIVGGLLWWLSGWYALPEGTESKTVFRIQGSENTWNIDSTEHVSAAVTLFSRGHETPQFVPLESAASETSPAHITVTAEYLELGSQFKALGFTKLWRIREITIGSTTSVKKNVDPWWYFSYLNQAKLRSMIQYVTIQRALYEQPHQTDQYLIQTTETGLIIKPEQ